MLFLFGVEICILGSFDEMVELMDMENVGVGDLAGVYEDVEMEGS